MKDVYIEIEHAAFADKKELEAIAIKRCKRLHPGLIELVGRVNYEIVHNLERISTYHFKVIV